MKTLHLILKAKWFDMIEAGIKLEEYREMKPYWVGRLSEHVQPWFRNLIQWDEIVFHRGYSNKTICVACNKVKIGKGKTEWGAEQGKLYIIFKLGAKK